MNFFRRRICFFLIFVCVVLGWQACSAVAGAGSFGRVLDEDFSYRGVYLGGMEAEMLAVLGEPDYDRTTGIFGIQVKRYEYGDVAFSVSVATKRVVDIELEGRNFRLRQGIRYGSTSYWIQRAYGSMSKQMLDGVICFVYAHPEHKHKHLLLRTDSETGALVSVRITSLPLNEEEAEEMMLDGSDIEEGLETETELPAGTEIDVSALPSAEEPKLVLGGVGQ